MHLAPIVFFCFNRAEKTKLVLESLVKNDLAESSEIYIFCDGPRNIKDLSEIEKVHKVIDSFEGFKKKHIVKRKINHGSQFSIIHGINQVFQKYDSIIVIEDDIITSRYFLKFINSSLEFYKDEKNVWCVTGFNYPKSIISYPKNYKEDIFFVKGKNASWGWGGWKDRWQKIDFDVKDYESFKKNPKSIRSFNRAGSNMFDMLRMQKEGKINAWDIQMCYSMFKNSGYSLHPIKPLTKNIGFDSSGTHTQGSQNIVNFEFEEFSEFKLKKLSEIPNNYLAEESYINYHRDPFFLVKWAKSKKKRRNFKWLLLGIIICQILNLLIRDI